MKVMSNYRVVVDVETSGLDPTTNALLSVGLVIINGREVIAEEEYNIHSKSKIIDPESMKINKINIDLHNNFAIQPAEAVQKIVQFIKANVPVDALPLALVGHNVDFDIMFLKQLFRENAGSNLWESMVYSSNPTLAPGRDGLYMYNEVFHYRKIDTQVIVRYYQDCGHFPTDSKNLSGWLEYFGIMFDASQMHGALYDAKKTSILYFKLLEYGEKFLNVT